MKANKLLNTLAIGTLVVLSFPVLAEWGELQVVVDGEISANEEGFSLSVGDSTIGFSRVTDVSSTGKIAISDSGNGRVKIYNMDGSLNNLLVPPVDNPRRKTYLPLFVGKNIVIATSSYYFYSPDGQLLVEHESADGSYFSYDVVGGRWFLTREKDNRKFWVEYSSEGELINTYDEKPLALGRYKNDVIGYHQEKLERTVIEYPDMNWIRIHEGGRCNEYDYVRDENGTVYCQLEKKISRFNACGRVVSEFEIPENDVVRQDVGFVAEPIVKKINALYGDVVLGDSGDVYSSRVSDTDYEVVYWPWQDGGDERNEGPFAPWRLKAQENDDSVTLTWLLSPHDGGCVTGYEVARTTTTGGPYAVIDTVGKSTGTYTDTTAKSDTKYYYAVRAVSAIAKSKYSNEVSAQLP